MLVVELVGDVADGPVRVRGNEVKELHRARRVALDVQLAVEEHRCDIG